MKSYGVCLSLSGLFHLAEYPQDTCMFLQITSATLLFLSLIRSSIFSIFFHWLSLKAGLKGPQFYSICLCFMRQDFSREVSCPIPETHCIPELWRYDFTWKNAWSDATRRGGSRPGILFSLLLKSVIPGMGRKVSNSFEFGIYVTDVPKIYNFVFRVIWMQVFFFFFFLNL